MSDEEILSAIRDRFPDIEVVKFRGDLIVRIPKEKLHDLMRFLHDDEKLSFNYLVMLTAVDFPDREERFEVVYWIRSIPNKTKIAVKTSVGEGEEVDTVSDIWNSANWDEREVYDMFGISFRNHPDMRRILMPDDWRGHPLRKDYPLKGTPEDDRYLDKHLPLGQLKKPKHTRMPW